MESLLHWDNQLFQFINQTATHPGLDMLLPLIREKRNWIPLYLLLAVFLLQKYRWRKGLLAIAIALATVGISDATSSKLIKPLVERPRPCHEASPTQARLLVPCGGGYSFTSSHATNHFALAMLFAGFLLPYCRHARWLSLLWAAGISYAQVYVGVHYPSDIMAGAILGMCIGYGMVFAFRETSRFFHTHHA